MADFIKLWQDETECMVNGFKNVVQNKLDRLSTSYESLTNIDSNYANAHKYQIENCKKILDKLNNWNELIAPKVKEIIEKVSQMHPYKQIGNRDSYSSYNEGWEDACDAIQSELEIKSEPTDETN